MFLNWLGLTCISFICSFFAVKYSIVTPENLKDIANAFRKSLKAKLKLNRGIKLKNAERKKKPSEIDLVFFSVVSRAGTDIDAALSKITRKKWLIEDIALDS